VLRLVSVYTHAVTTTPVEPPGAVAHRARRCQPSLSPTGRPPHWYFRGLLSVYSRYGLRARQVAMRPSPPEASAASLPPPLLRLLLAGATVARRESHPLKTNAFHGARDTIPIAPYASVFGPVFGAASGARAGTRGARRTTRRPAAGRCARESEEARLSCSQLDVERCRRAPLVVLRHMMRKARSHSAHQPRHAGRLDRSVPSVKQGVA